MSRRILVVEDEEWWRRLLSHKLKDKGFDVVLAEGYDKGLSLGCEKKDRLHLAIIDLELRLNSSGAEKYQGLELILGFRDDGCLFPCIVLSRFTNVEIDSYKYGAVNFIEKEEKPGDEFFDKLYWVIEALIAQYLNPTISTDETVIERGPIKVDTVSTLVSVSGDVVALTHSEYDVLYLLLTKPSASVDELIEHVYKSRKDRANAQKKKPSPSSKKKKKPSPPSKNCVEQFIRGNREKILDKLDDKFDPIPNNAGRYRLYWSSR